MIPIHFGRIGGGSCSGKEVSLHVVRARLGARSQFPDPSLALWRCRIARVRASAGKLVGFIGNLVAIENGAVMLLVTA